MAENQAIKQISQGCWQRGILITVIEINKSKNTHMYSVRFNQL